LCFRLFGFPVRVHPLFWLTALVLGPTRLDVPDAGARILIWIGIVFVSILVHELGHAFAYRAFNCPGTEVWLYWFGGLAGGSSRPAGHWPNIIISLAGPGLQLLLCAAVYLSNEVTPWVFAAMPYTFFLYAWLIVVNLYWPIFNLLPVFPLDGGQVMREVCHLARLRQPEAAAMTISIVTALAVVLLSLANHFGPPEMLGFLPEWLPRPSLFTALFFGALAYSAYEQLQSLQRDRGFNRGGSW